MAVAVNIVVCSVVEFSKVVSAGVVVLVAEVELEALVTVIVAVVEEELVLVIVMMERVVCSVVKFPKIVSAAVLLLITEEKGEVLVTPVVVVAVCAVEENVLRIVAVERVICSAVGFWKDVSTSVLVVLLDIDVEVGEELVLLVVGLD
jgi:hypothetical protein